MDVNAEGVTPTRKTMNFLLQLGVHLGPVDTVLTVAEPDPRSAVAAFNERINARDVDGLAALMTDDHTFVDSAGANLAPKSACVEAWRGFFAAYPDYRNVFTSLAADGDTVTITGYSQCSDPGLAGPARWTATVRDGRIARWQVSDV